MKKRDTISSWDFWSPVKVCLNFSTWSCCFRLGRQWTGAMGECFFEQLCKKRVQSLPAWYDVVFSQIIQTWLVRVCPLVILGGINGFFKAELNQSVSCKTSIYTYIVCVMQESKKTFYCLNSCSEECFILNFKLHIFHLSLAV